MVRSVQDPPQRRRRVRGPRVPIPLGLSSFVSAPGDVVDHESSMICERRAKDTLAASAVPDLHAPCCVHVPRVPTHPVPDLLPLDARQTTPRKTS